MFVDQRAGELYDLAHVPNEWARTPVSNPPHIVFAGAATVDMIFSVDTLPQGPGKVLPKGIGNMITTDKTSPQAPTIRSAVSEVRTIRRG